MTDGGGSIRRSGNPRGRQASRDSTDEAILSEEEVVRRVDLREAVPHDDAPAWPWIGEEPAASPTAEVEGEAATKTKRVRTARAATAAAAAATASEAAVGTGGLAPPALETVRRTRLSADERRRQLWRDSATILIGVVIALLVGQTLIPAETAAPGPSDTPLPSTVAIGSAAPRVSLPPGVTFGPIINPSLGVDASPTPIPVITMGPTPSPTPSPSPSIKPSAKPTSKPTPKPTPRPTRTPTPTSSTPPPTPAPTAPPPDASFSTVIVDLKVQFNNTSTGATAWHWEFGNGAISNAREPTYTYPAAGTYSVTLTVSGPGGPDSSVTRDVTVPPAP